MRILCKVPILVISARIMAINRECHKGATKERTNEKKIVQKVLMTVKQQRSEQFIISLI